METIANYTTHKGKLYKDSLDIEDGYYSIPVYEPHQKFLKFEY